jgi:uncharacterized protein (DUF433 family)
MKKHNRIEVNPDVMLGKPVVRGTRLTVQHIMDQIHAGLSVSEILDAHPRLTADDIEAVRTFAAEYMTEAAE